MNSGDSGLRNNPEFRSVQIIRASEHEREPTHDFVAAEEPLEIRVRGESIAVTMRTPGHDEELAAGFLVAEGLIHSPSHIVEIAHCQTAETAGNVLNVFLAPSARFDVRTLTRHVFASSSCGICGKASIEAIQKQFSPVGAGAQIALSVLTALPAKLRAAQATFERTGGLHAAGLFDFSGELLLTREDVGRHNAVDKLLGHALFAGKIPLSERILLVSGRASFEIVQKALAGGIPIIAAVSAPSSLAVELAEESNQTLVGFLRGQTCNIYTHPERIA